MTNREKALKIADDVKEQIENGGIALGGTEALGYALVLVLADIGERLQGIEDTLDRMHEYRTGMDDIRGV